MDASTVAFALISGFSGNPILSGLAVLILFALVQDFFLFRRLKKLVRGGDGKSLETTIRKLIDRVELLEKKSAEEMRVRSEVSAKLGKSIQAVSVERFDPFQNASGQQSFATALLSESGNGVVLSGIHARDGVRVYAKDVKEFNSSRELSDEEKSAILSAKRMLGKGD